MVAFARQCPNEVAEAVLGHTRGGVEGIANKGAGALRFDLRPQHLFNIGLKKLLLWLADEHRLVPLLLRA